MKNMKMIALLACMMLENTIFSGEGLQGVTWKKAPQYNVDTSIANTSIVDTSIIEITDAILVDDIASANCNTIVVGSAEEHNFVMQALQHYRQNPVPVQRNQNRQDQVRDIEDELSNIRDIPYEDDCVGKDCCNCYSKDCCIAALCIASLSYLESGRNCCRCSQCCVVGEKHPSTDGLCCPPTATLTICGPIKCTVLYDSNTTNCICENLGCSCCLLAAIPFVPVCICYKAACGRN